MEVKFNSLRDLVKLIIEGTVTFNDDSSAYSLIETMCDTYFEDEQVARIIEGIALLMMYSKS